jgi:hypothetical protein
MWLSAFFSSNRGMIVQCFDFVFRIFFFHECEFSLYGALFPILRGYWEKKIFFFFFFLQPPVLQPHHMCMSSLIAPTRPRRLSFENSKRLEEASTDYMDAERDIKPFVFPTVPTTIQRNFHGPGARQPTARPLERCGTRVLPQTHRPCSAPRLSRKFWGAGDYDAVAGRSAPQPPSMSQRWRFFVWILLILRSIPLTLTLLRRRSTESHVRPPGISPLQRDLA